MSANKFGRSRQPAAAVASRRLLAPKDLPGKGISYHSNHLRLLWQAGKFPKPIYLSPRKLAWPEDVLDAWIATKVMEP